MRGDVSFINSNIRVIGEKYTVVEIFIQIIKIIIITKYIGSN